MGKRLQLSVKGGDNLLPLERQNEIIKLLQEFRSVKIADLCKRLDVTRETIRKDLYEMEERGLIKKVHGGAILNKASFETKYANRKSTNNEEKQSIAKNAAEFVSDGDTIYIDYGTTALYFTRELMNKKDLTIITNSLPIASELTEYTEFEVVVIGGVIRKNENSLFGPIAYRSIENLFVDIGFFGIGGIDSKAGYTNFHMGESEVSRLMVKHSQKRVMMADYTKFNTVALNKVASFEDIHVLITDEKADQETLQAIKNNNTSVIVVEIEGNEEDEYVTR